MLSINTFINCLKRLLVNKKIKGEIKALSGAKKALLLSLFDLFTRPLILENSSYSLKI